MAGILVIPAPLAAVGILWAQGPSGRWYQLGAQSLLQNLAPIRVQRRVAGEARSSVVPFLVPTSSGPSLSFPVLLLFPACLGPGVVSEFTKFLQLHEFRRSASKVVEVGSRLHTQAIDKWAGCIYIG